MHMPTPPWRGTGILNPRAARDERDPYDRMRAMRPGQTQDFRDVYSDQRIMPADANRPHLLSYRAWYRVSLAAGILAALLFWGAFSMLEWMALRLVHRHDPVKISMLGCLGWTGSIDLVKFGMMILICAVVTGALGFVANRRITAYNRSIDHADLSQHADSSHIQLPKEVAGNYLPFPNAGAHSGIVANGIVSCMMISNKGLSKTRQTRFRDQDEYDRDGDVVAYEGSPILDADGDPVQRSVPMVDTRFADELWDASGLPRDPDLRKRFDPTDMPYGRKGDDGATLDTWADLINADWEYPDYETQRPGGVYMVSDEPINTTLLAMTRAGKGQTYIEPMIDIWSREKHHRNMVVNDPKGELLHKFFVPLVKRGFEVNSFNLMLPSKTDIYNPIWMAADAARKGDTQKCSSYITAISEVFFPVSDKTDDPMWPNAAANAFKRSCYGLIDYYLEEEAELVADARAQGRTLADISEDIDKLWGHVTLYNCYEYFVTLASQKMENPIVALNKEVQKHPPETDEERMRVAERTAEATRKAAPWKDAPRADMLTLYFNATRMLPKNSIRGMLNDADDSLRSMAGSDKTISSVYGIALTAMIFFTDPTIRTLTSGRPSQTLDLASLSFPRRINVRLDRDYMEEYNLKNMQVVWQAYHDRDFTRPMGKEFRHEDTLDEQGWARMYLEGVFPEDRAYLKLTIQDPNPSIPVELDTFHFQFRKGYRKTFDGTKRMVDPVNHETMPSGGVLIEMLPAPEGSAHRFVKGVSQFRANRLHIEPTGGVHVPKSAEEGDLFDVITAVDISYTERQKAIFVVTPPHLKTYAKLILILIRQLFDLNVESSYTTKASQKPLYTTSYMLDELGNLESEGKGINGFATMLSIGLGQSQQFTLVLQTMQQLKDLYGEKVDKTIMGNTANLVYLKGNDGGQGGMLQELSQTSGTTDRVYINSKTINANPKAILSVNAAEETSMTLSTQKEEVISVNELLHLPKDNSIVFPAGQNPIWNRNETILPMSWKLLGHTITNPGHHYSMQTLPTLSTAQYFDVEANVPDFFQMFRKRMAQAEQAKQAIDEYQEAYGLSENEMKAAMSDDAAAEIMSIDRVLTARAQMEQESRDASDADDYDIDDPQPYDDPDLGDELAKGRESAERASRKIFADGTVSPDMLVTVIGADTDQPYVQVNRQMADILRMAAVAAMSDLASDRQHFAMVDGNLCSSGTTTDADGHSGHTVYVSATPVSDEYEDLKRNGAIDEDEDTPDVEYDVTDDFIEWLAGLDTWRDLGRRFVFDQAVANAVRAEEAGGLAGPGDELDEDGRVVKAGSAS